MQATKHNRLPRIKVLVLAVHTAIGGIAWALPQDATIVNGQVAISRAAPGALQVTASNGAIINWKQFSIGASESTQFIQPSASSAVLNRVTGPGVSQLLGQLKANGNVFLINPNGIVVGGGARIDTNSFIGSTLDMTDADFIAGKLRFFAGSAAGKIRNDGMITAGPGGRIALIAPDIENTGIIRAQDGNILLAAGRKLEIASLDLEGVTFEIQAPTDSVLNLGKLLAENGAVRAFAGSLRHSGEIRASRMVQQADGSIVLAGSNDVTLTLDSVTHADGAAGGSVVLQSSNGTTRVAGDISAIGSTGAGGDIRVLGQQVAVEAGTRIDASGSAGGGQILVGGDFQGHNPAVQNASRVYVAAGAQLKADATEQGDGGRVIVWADGNTRYFGDLSARGGPLGGDGGFAEVSGKGNLQFAGGANLGAPAGKSGTLLLDPLDILVSASSGIMPIVVDEFADFADNVVTVSPDTLAKVAGNVTLQARRDIYVKDAIALTTPGAGIAATAGGASFVGAPQFDTGAVYNNAGITTNGGPVTLRGVAISGAGGITTSGGAVDLLTSGSLNYDGAISSGGGTVTVAAQAGSVDMASVNAGAGTINATAIGPVRLDVGAADRVNASSSNSYVDIRNSATGPLRLGAVSGTSGVYLHSSSGMEQAAGGALTGPYINLYTDSSSVAAGTVAAPLLIAAASAQVQPEVTVYEMAAPVHLGFSGAPTLGALSLNGSVAALGASTVAAGSANLTSMTFGAGSGVLNVSAVATGGLARGLTLNVSDGAINAPTLTLPGAPVTLSSTGAVTVGTMSGDRLSISAKGAVGITSATTTGSSGINVSTQQCNDNNVACTASSPITVGTLDAGTTGRVRLHTYDNGNITVSGSLSGRNLTLEAGETYRTSASDYYQQLPTSNSIDIASATSSGYTEIYNYGSGNTTIGSLTAASYANVTAGTTYYTAGNPNYSQQATNGNINITSASTTGDLYVYNNGAGNVTIGSLTSGRSATIQAGTTYNTSRLQSYPYPTYSQATTGNIVVNSATTATSFNAYNYGHGDVTVGSLASSGSVSINAGSTYEVSAPAYPYSTSVTTNNNIAITTTEPASANGSFNVDNSGIGTLMLAGAINRPNGSVSLNASNGSVTASGNISAQSNIDVTSGTSSVNVADLATSYYNINVNAATTLTVGQVSAGSGSTYGNVTLTAGGDLNFKSISAAADPYYSTYYGYGSVNLTSYGGSIRPVVDSIALDITASGNVNITANDLTNGFIGSAAFLNPMDIQAGAASSVTLSAGRDIGAPGKPVNVDTSGTLDLTTLGGAFHVAATDGMAPTTLSAIRIAASAAGIGTVGPSTLTSADLDVTASSDGSAITIGNVNLTRGVGGLALNEFQFSATGTSELKFANVSLDTPGLNQLVLSATNGLTQASPLTNAITVGSANLASGAGAMTIGDVTARSVTATGASLAMRSVTTTGTGRSTNGAVPDALTLSASGDLLVSGDLTTATAMHVDSTGGNLNVTGAVTGSGSSRYTYYQAPDQVVLHASGNITTGGEVASATTTSVAAGGSVSVGGVGVSGGIAAPTCCYYQTDTVTVTAGTASSIDTAAITGGFYKTVSGGTLNVLGGITGAAGDTTLNATTFNTGNLQTTNTLTINTTAAYAPASTITLSAATANITAPGGIDLFNETTPASAMLTAATVNLKASAGDIKATLAGTTSLTINSGINTGGKFDVVSSGTLTNLDITADGTVAGVGAPSRNTAPSSVSANGGNQLLTVTNGTGLAVDVTSSTGLNTYYRETSSVTDLALSAGSYSGGLLYVSAPVANITTPSVAIGNGSLQLYTDGDISLGSVSGGVSVYVVSNAGTVNLTSVDTGGGYVTAQTYGDASKNINVERIVTGGGNVSLTADNGSILRAGAQPLQISTLNGLGASSGTTTLSAPNGSVGTAGTPLLTTGAVALDVNARNDIAVDVAGTPLTNLYITTSAAGSGTVAVTNANFATLSVARTGGGADLTLTGLNPGSPGAFSLTATDGNILVGSDISNVTSLHLNAGNGYNGTGDLVISASGGLPRAVSANDYDLRAGHDVVIRAGALAGENVSVTQTGTSGYTSVYAGNDIKLTADGGSALLGHSAAGWTQTLNAGHDLRVTGGSAGVTGASAAIAATGYQNLHAGGDLVIQAGGSDGALASVTATQTQTSSGINNLSVTGGGPNASAQMSAASQDMSAIYGNVTVQGGSGAASFAEIVTTTASGQTIGSNYYYYATDAVLVQGGTGTGSYASIRSAGSQSIGSTANISVLGNAASGSDAELNAAGSQSVGSTSTYYYTPTANILVQAGAGGTARILSGSSQTVMAGGTISVLGGTGTDMTASIESTAGSQSIGDSTTSYYNDPTGNILVQGGTGLRAFASVKANGQQSISTGGTISVLGNSGSGALAEILSVTGGQTIGSTSISNNDPTDSILVQAGSGGIARIQAQGNQTIMTGGDLSVKGGTGVNMTAAIESVGGFQSIGDTRTSYYSRDASGNLSVQGGSASGSAAWIKAATGQTIDAGGTFVLAGGAAGAFAEVSTTAGSQQIGNVNGAPYYDPTDSISLSGGSAAGSYARLSTAGAQNLRTSVDLLLYAGVGDGSGAMVTAGTSQNVAASRDLDMKGGTGNSSGAMLTAGTSQFVTVSRDLSMKGGAGDNSGAMLTAASGQNVTVYGNLAMTGGSGSAPGLNETAIRNQTSSNQSVFVEGNLGLTSGGFGSDTWIKQNGPGVQNISAGGNLSLLAPSGTGNTGVTSIESQAGRQNIDVGGAMTIDNQGGWHVKVTSGGVQNINAQSLAISLASNNGTAPLAGLSATGDQTINLSGDGSMIADPLDAGKSIVAPSATLTLTNLSGATGSLAAITTQGNMSIWMDYQESRSTNYGAAGLVRIGSVDGQGAATISAAKDLTMVAGELLMQGGATAASDARLLSGDQPGLPPTNTMTISTLYGPVTMLGGSSGGAYIDPLQLDLVSNGAVLMQAGVNASANTNITAGTFNVAATNQTLFNGVQNVLGLYNSKTSTATSTITASNFNFGAVGTINLVGGTVTATNGGTFSSNVTPPGSPVTLFCNNCDTNLIGLFFFGTNGLGQPLAGVPRPPPSVPTQDFGAVVMADLVALGDLAIDMFDTFYDEAGNLVFTRRRLNQCY